MKRIGWTILILTAVALLGLGCSNSSSDNGGDADFTPADGDTDATDQPADGDGLPGDGDLENEQNLDNDKESDSIIITPTDGDDEAEGESGCRSQSDCHGDQYCDEGTGVCRPRGRLCSPCTESEECGYSGTGDVCLDTGLCGQYCDTMTPCPTGFFCNPELEQCTFPTDVNNGETGATCCTNDNCTPPLVCNLMTNKCTPGCSSTSGCPSGTVCYDDPSDNRDGQCIVGCIDNIDCNGGEVCLAGECVEGDCAKKADCPIEYLCNTTELVCYSGCEDDGDCYARNECRIPDGGTEKQCLKRIGCEGTYQCSLGYMCTVELEQMGSDPEDRGCCFDAKQESSPIEGDKVCTNPFGPQKFCDVCTDTNNETKECGEGSACVELTDSETEESKGFFCLIKWDCSARNDEGVMDEGTLECPRGYGCIKIESDNLNGKFCMADCTNENLP